MPATTPHVPSITVRSGSRPRAALPRGGFVLLFVLGVASCSGQGSQLGAWETRGRGVVSCSEAPVDGSFVAARNEHARSEQMTRLARTPQGR